MGAFMTWDRTNSSNLDIGGRIWVSPFWSLGAQGRDREKEREILEGRRGGVGAISSHRGGSIASQKGKMHK